VSPGPRLAVARAGDAADFLPSLMEFRRIVESGGPVLENLDQIEEWFRGRCASSSQQKHNDPGSAHCEWGNPGSFSSRGRTRTYDKPVNSRLLYQLSYAGMADGKT
jgi:hypothetical protein